MLSLYLHIPYCVRKCPYCGFYSTQYSKKDADGFIEALRLEATSHQDDFSQQSFQTVYIGGGTPTALSEDQVDELGAILTEHVRIAAAAEITIEANPNSVTKRKLAAWRKWGVNRLSLGVQSFSDDVLRALGRIHTASQAREAFHEGRNAGFRNVGMDLMYGIPKQTEKHWRETLAAAVDCGPEHLSVYSLSLDDGSLFKKQTEAGMMETVDDDLAADMYEHAVSTLTAAGYRRYEISNFSLPGRECRHNLNYWRRGEYLGLGPGAWSFMHGRRFRNIADTDDYIKRLNKGVSPVGESESPGPEQTARETVMLSLRTAQGLDLRDYRERYGTRFLEGLEAAAAALLREGLVLIKEGKLILTERGILLSNGVLSRLTG